MHVGSWTNMAIAHPHVVGAKVSLKHKWATKLAKPNSKGQELNSAQETSSPSQATICFPRVKFLLAESRPCAQDNPKKPKDIQKYPNDNPEDKTTPFIGFDFFDDGIPDDDSRRSDFDFYFSRLEKAGKESIPQLIKKLNDNGRPVSCLVNNPFIPWACDVAEDLKIPWATLWVQSSAVFAVYYHFFHQTVPFPSEAEPDIDVQLTSMPALKRDEIPSFLIAGNPYEVFGKTILEQFKNLSKSFCVLADTFEELEQDIIRALSGFCMVRPIGPLFKGPKDIAVTRGSECLEWLDSKPPSTVVYISFGTVAYLKQEQVDEMAHGVLNSGMSFLWVMRPPKKESGLKPHVLPEGFLETIGDRGKFVEWSPQERVLAHPSVTCFLTHCGWNSSVEALTLGVPVVCFPQWGDQVTNAKFLVDVFGVGVRLGRGEAENRVVPRDEVERCLVEATVGEKAAEMKRNAVRWKKAAEEAVEKGGLNKIVVGENVEDAWRNNNVTRGFNLSSQSNNPRRLGFLSIPSRRTQKSLVIKGTAKKDNWAKQHWRRGECSLGESLTWQVVYSNGDVYNAGINCQPLNRPMGDRKGLQACTEP
ncbi:Putative UDP-glucose glucosyltransferase [Morus notabilis]|uniref:Glycosyltransferase n=1 Tax=Morus notabilis TaxID=981085 RepID=W9R9H4_9ROSA|nr:Putative UDP-glucose glucosyltransferase [Morus notabilis]